MGLGLTNIINYSLFLHLSNAEHLTSALSKKEEKEITKLIKKLQPGIKLLITMNFYKIFWHALFTLNKDLNVFNNGFVQRNSFYQTTKSNNSSWKKKSFPKPPPVGWHLGCTFYCFTSKFLLFFSSVILDTYFINCTVCAVYKKIEPSITSSTETMKF
jgi:hypothetical protein